ncbi:MAG TPA: hypothetical protein VHC69_15720 [Polyangiaceae bacterium]|nr:hypothetical protein [Polyangiaceae bacterium]
MWRAHARRNGAVALVRARSRDRAGALLVLVSALAASCASGTAPPAAPAPEGAVSPPPNAAPAKPSGASTTPLVGTASGPAANASAAETSPAPSTAPAAASNRAKSAGASPADDECGLERELELAYERIGEGAPRNEWLESAREKLLPPDVAERAFTGISQEILSALAHRKYEKLAAFAGKDGVCMRATKNAPCQELSPRALSGCAASRVHITWPVGPGDEEPPPYDCRDAFQHIFYARDFLHVGEPHFNCFSPANGGSGAASIIASGPHIGYVELRSEGAGGTRSLWLVFDGDARAPELVEMIGDHAGS